MCATINAEAEPNKSSAINSRAGRDRVIHALMPFQVAACVALLFVSPGCSDDCLVPPDSDESPPDIRIVLEYGEIGSGEIVRHEHADADTSVTLRADRNDAVHITYEAIDSAGVRRLFPGLTIHHTVGIGVERRHVKIRPTQASCPQVMLEQRHEVHGTGEERVLIITAGAENWGERRTSIEPISVRLE